MFIEKMLSIEIQLAFIIEKTIIATFDYKTATFDYIIETSDYITATFDYSLY